MVAKVLASFPQSARRSYCIRQRNELSNTELDALVMGTGKTSTLEVLWATRSGGGGRTERRYRDFVLDGVGLSTVLAGDLISPFGWGSVDEQVAVVDRLLRRLPPDLPEGRVSLYICPECGDLGCGAVSVIVEGVVGGVVWRDFAYQNNYEDAVHRTGYEALGPFFFEERPYVQAMEQLRRDAQVGGV
jgi:hypothetical protein